MERSPRVAQSDATVTLASLRPALEYGWPAGARWLGDDADSARASLEQPVGRPVVFRLRLDEGWRLRAEAGLPDGAAPALAWARVALREPGGTESVIWWGVLGRAGRTVWRHLDVELGAEHREIDLVFRAGGLGVDRVRWSDPVLHRGELE